MMNQIQNTNVKWKLADLFVVIAVSAAAILAMNFFLLKIDLESVFLRSKDRSIITLLLFLIQEILFLTPLYFLVIRKYRLKLRDLGLRAAPLKSAVLLILKAYGMVILFNIVLALALFRFGLKLPGFGEQIPHIPLFGKSAFDMAIAVFVLIGIGPIIEEIVFRGFLLQTLLSRIKPLFASLIAAGFFALVHFEFQSIGMIFFLALVINWLFIRSRSIWPCVAFHMINNGIALILEWLVL